MNSADKARISRNDDLEKEGQLAGECPVCEGDLAATPDAKNVKCKECGYEEPTYAEQ